MSGERTEKPTGKRLSEARARGQVARSPEVNSTLVLLGSFATLAIAAPAMWSTLKSTFHDTIVRTANPEISTTTVPGLMDGWMQTVAGLLLPLFAVAAVAGVTANVIQNKPGLILSGIKPDFKKLSPVPGLKRMVGPGGADRARQDPVQGRGRRHRRLPRHLARAAHADAHGRDGAPARWRPTPAA